MTDKAAHLTNLFTDLTSSLEEANYQHNRYIDFHDTIECASQPDASEYDYAKSKADDACHEILTFLQDQDQNIQGLSSFQRTIEALQTEVYHLADMEELTFELPDPSDFEPPAPPDDPELVFGFDFKQAIHDNFLGTFIPANQGKMPITPMPDEFSSVKLNVTSHTTDINPGVVEDEIIHHFLLELTIKCANTTQTTTTTPETTSPTCASSETPSSVENVDSSNTQKAEPSSASSDTSSTGKEA